MELVLDRSRRVVTGGRCKELAPGGPYFEVTYRQEGVNLPDIETLVYLGMTQVQIDGKLQTRFMFQYAWSYQEDGPWPDLSKDQRRELAADGSVFFCPEEMLSLIADVDGLIRSMSNLREHIRAGLGWERVLPPEP